MSSSLPASYLQQEASKAINDAIKFERNGNYELAIKRYESALNILLKLVELDPNYQLNNVYIDRIGKCQTKIAQLKKLLDRKEEIIIDDNFSNNLILKNIPEVKWNEIVGLEEVKNAIREAILYPSKRPELFPLGWPRNILLFGPPGCGKTLLCAAIAFEIDGIMITVDAPSLFSKWLGESEKNVARLFLIARKYEREGKTVIIFLDEADSIFGIRSYEVGGEVRARNQFLKEMDDLIDKKSRRRIYLVASTNKPWDLDIPFIRRFQLRLYVPPPDKYMRIGLFKMYSRPLNPSSDVDFIKLADMTENYSGSDIRDICIQIQNILAKEIFEKNNGIGNLRRPGMDDFLKVIRNWKASISRDIVIKYERWYEMYKTI